MIDLIEILVEDEDVCARISLDDCMRQEVCCDDGPCDACIDLLKNDLKYKVNKWLSSFDTSSATKCFEAIQILKERCGDADLS